MKKKLIFFLLTIYLSSLNAIANIASNCGNDFNQKTLNKLDELKIELIEIKVQNNRKWITNGIKILIDNSRITPAKYKKRFAADIIIKYEEGLQCKFPAKIRHHGDYKDHIALSENSLIQSLDIHLKSGNIKGVTKFKLFLQNTRGNYEDEILMTELLREFNYLSPRTSFIQAKINDIETAVIFQEKAGKELLEYNYRREGPIFEGQENYMFGLVENIVSNQKSPTQMGFLPLLEKGVNGQLAKQTNSNWNNKGEQFSLISHQAISNLNLAYLLYINGYQDKKNKSHYNTYGLNNELLAFNNPNNILKLEIYNLLMFSANGSHGLGPYNRKFYWNSIENYFEPINYDSDFNIDNEPWFSYFYLPFSNRTLEAFKDLDDLLSKVNTKKLQTKMKLNGIDFSEVRVGNKIKKIRQNLATNKSWYKKINQDLLDYNLDYKIKKEMWDDYIISLNKIDPNIFIIYSQQSEELNDEKNYPNKNAFYKCDTKNFNCTQIKFTNEEQNKLIEGKLNFQNAHYQYIGEYFKTNMTSNILKFKKLILNNSNFYFDENINFYFDEKNKILDIYQLKSGARAFFHRGTIEDILINFYGHKKEDPDHYTPNYPINENNLTGCLSFINLSVKNITIKSDRSSCEDTINFINVKGNIKTVDIINSYKDGLDIDFSKIRIDYANIKFSGNDCIDLSSGEYKLNKLVLSNCGDKGLSIGEKSKVEVKNISVKIANIGISSKDSSIATVINADISNTAVCLESKNKKQEFAGSILNLKNSNCHDAAIFIDKESFINHLPS